MRKRFKIVLLISVFLSAGFTKYNNNHQFINDIPSDAVLNEKNQRMNF